jgi:DNA-binding HxlR family transcriptional regulator
MDDMVDDISDNNKILESIFEPNNSEILVQMESGSKKISDLAKNLDIPKEKIEQSLSYLMEHGFVSKIEKDNQVNYSVNADMLSKVLENNDNFKNVDDGLAKLDSFLN